MTSETLRAWRSVDRNLIALLASVIPGAGHLYKHHYLIGFSILIGGNLLMIFTALLLGFATFGLSMILVPAIYVAAVAASAYDIPDNHGKHRWLHPWQPAEEEKPTE
jgi:hypothetical protein